jgi:hypothetical protein
MVVAAEAEAGARTGSTAPIRSATTIHRESIHPARHERITCHLSETDQPPVVREARNLPDDRA